MGIAAAIGGGALLGGIAGSQSKTTKTSGTSGINLGAAGSLEELLGGSSVLSSNQNTQIKQLQEQLQSLETGDNKNGIFGIIPDEGRINKLKDQIAQIKANPEGRAGGLLQEQFGGIQDLIGLGARGSDITAGREATLGVGDLLSQMQETSGLPTESDIGAAQGITSQLFQPQQVAFQQQLEDASIANTRQRAALGRSAADPILAAKLAQEAARGQERIGAAQGAATQQLAMQLPQQRLGFATQRASLLSGLGDQALQARVGLLGLGSQLLGQERQFRIATGERFTTGKQTSGGGLGGALTGALGGAGAGLSAFSSFGSSNALSGLMGAQAQSSGGLFPGANAAIPANPFAGGGGSVGLNQGFGVPTQFGMSPRPFF